ncbi:MAG: hypothetical protein ACOX22_09360 [Caldicoprobacterales bacterium]
MTHFKRWLFRSVSISVLSIIISLLIGAYTNVAYAEMSAPSEDQSANISDIFSVDSDLGESETGKAPEQLKEQYHALPENSAGNIIISYAEFSEIIISEDEQIHDLDLLKKSGRLPRKAVLHTINGEGTSLYNRG